MVTTRRFTYLAITGFCLGLLLGGCGRKAALEIPSASTQPAAASPTATDVPANGTPAPQAPAQNSGFILDPLIGQ